MKTKVLRAVILVTSIVSIFGAKLVLAVGDGPTGGTIGSNQPALDSKGATDVWILACPKGTQSARASINEGNNDAIQISLVISDQHGKAVATSGENGGLSPQAILRGGPGAYIVTLHKDGLGLDGYTSTIDCYDANGVRISGDQATLVQNQ